MKVYQNLVTSELIYVEEETVFQFGRRTSNWCVHYSLYQATYIGNIYNLEHFLSSYQELGEL